MQLFLEHGEDVNAWDKAQDTPLHLASSKSWPEIVQVLLDHGAEADARNADGQNPLHRVPQLQYYHSLHGANIVMQLLKHEVGSDVNERDKDQETPLHLASYYLSSDLVKVLLDYGAQVDAEDNRGLTPLHQLVLGNHKCQSLSGTGRLEPWDSRAIYTAHLLLERGADVNAQNKDNETPLHLASRLRLHELARLLLEHGADLDVKNSEGKSPLLVTTRRKGKAMRWLLSEYSAK